MINTPAQANCCHSANGLIANLKIVTGRLAIGCIMSVLQNWLESAVNSSGAVSPAIRAIASRIPVMIPDTDAFSEMCIRDRCRKG